MLVWTRNPLDVEGVLDAAADTVHHVVQGLPGGLARVLPDAPLVPLPREYHALPLQDVIPSLLLLVPLHPPNHALPPWPMGLLLAMETVTVLPKHPEHPAQEDWTTKH